MDYNIIFQFIMDNITIRELRLKDMKQVREIDILTQRVYRGRKWDALKPKEKEKLLVSKKKEFKINCQTGFSFVAEKASKIVGFIFAYEALPFPGKIQIHHIAVRPLHQRQGIGEALLKSVIRKARNNKKKEIISFINPDNPPSIKLHQHLGFTIRDRKQAIFKL